MLGFGLLAVLLDPFRDGGFHVGFQALGTALRCGQLFGRSVLLGGKQVDALLRGRLADLHSLIARQRLQLEAVMIELPAVLLGDEMLLRFVPGVDSLRLLLVGERALAEWASRQACAADKPVKAVRKRRLARHKGWCYLSHEA